MKDPLLIVATLVAKPGHEGELRSALLPAVEKFRNEPGCEGYVLLEDRQQPGRFLTYETWRDEAALAEHMKAPALTALGPTLKTLLAGEIKQDFLSVLVAR